VIPVSSIDEEKRLRATVVHWHIIPITSTLQETALIYTTSGNFCNLGILL